ncbi:MAG: endonuclease/exonuclease/phosphatase family protein [Chloroflexota bacterium]|nr:endonuclease/exonuclease/phosphatase family protein [Chloroflexota bacterium]
MERRKPTLWKYLWVLVPVFIIVVMILALLLINSISTIKPSDMTTNPNSHETPVPEKSFSVVSFNTWRLCDAQRVPKVVEALSILGNDRHPDGGPDNLPDIVLFQEIECVESLDKLEESLSETHWFGSNICARDRSGELRSAVAIAVKRSRFEVVEEHSLDLGRIYPDHQRCANSVTVSPRDGPQLLHVVNVHHTPHPLGLLQTRRLVEELRSIGLMEAEHVILGGDFNFTPSSSSYRLLTSFLRDPYPADRGRTHWVTGRIDYLLTSEDVVLIQPLDRLVAYEAVKPAGLLETIFRYSDQESSQWPVSDHLPEGGLFAFREDLPD